MNRSEFYRVWEKGKILEKVNSLKDLSVYLGVDRRVMSQWVEDLGIHLPRIEGCSIATKLRLLEKFRVISDPIVSYIYGFYLGDGWVVQHDGKVHGIELDCQDPGDFDNFQRLEDCLNCGKLIREKMTRSGFTKEKQRLRFIVLPKTVIQPLVDAGLVWCSKSKIHPEFKVEYFDKFDFWMLFRGLIDTDGRWHRKGNSQYLALHMVWESLLFALQEKLKSFGLYCSMNKSNVTVAGNQSWTLYISDDSCRKMLEMGLYEKFPELCVDRKRVLNLYVQPA